MVTGLWDSWADNAFIRDVEHGIFFDPTKMHVLDHKGRYLSVRGPLNIAPPVQGWLVIVQAGASETGRQLAAETAEAVFTAQSDLAAGQQFYRPEWPHGRTWPLARTHEDFARLLCSRGRHDGGGTGQAGETSAPEAAWARGVQCCERSLAAYYDLARQVARLIQHVVHAAPMHSQQESVSFMRSFVR
jgi:alkanesulfonate monooxygenase SsuD/methylene tetrahydromethanopterin reductase-like flavin-dependent oxidoreductase (luciferase family)